MDNKKQMDTVNRMVSDGAQGLGDGKGEALMEKGSWVTTQSQSRVGKVTGLLPARVCPSLVSAPNSTPGGKGHTAATAGGRSQHVAPGGPGCC